jgi:hypothetical protein
MAAIDLSKEIDAFQRNRASMIGEFGSAWVVFVDAQLKGHFSTFQKAAQFAFENFASSPFLIRHTMEPTLKIPFAESRD